MAKEKRRFRHPTAEEQVVLREMEVRLLTQPRDYARFDQLLVEHHYLHNAHLVGEQLRYVVVWKDQWLALASWSAATFHLKARDAFIGWTEVQRRERLPLVVNNSRLCVLADWHYPNLVSRFMKLMLVRLSEDWQRVWQHPVALAETFVDPHLYQGTAYKVSGWTPLGHTQGWKRSAVDFYEKHDAVKQIWIRELAPQACQKLCAPQLPPEWASAVSSLRPRCTAKVQEIGSLLERLEQKMPEFRRRQSLAYPVAGVLALIAMANFSGVILGYEDLADYAATLSQGQLRALRFARDRHTGHFRCPQRTTFERVLTAADGAILEQVLLLWQEQVLGPAQNSLVIIDGKEIRHANVQSVSAVSGTGRWLGSTRVAEDSNEIPAGRQQLAKLDLAGQIVLADAAHTQVEHAQQILYQQGGDYLLTVKANQKDLVQTLEKLLTPQRFSPSTDPLHPSDDPREQPGPARNPGARLPGGLPPDDGLPRSAEHRAVAAPRPAPRQEDHRDRLSDQQPDLGGVGCGGLS